MKKYFLLLFLAFLLSGASIVGAQESENGEDKGRVEERRDENKERVELRKEEKNEIKVEDKAEVKNIELKERVDIKNDRFEITGKITSISDNSFTVMDQTVMIDPTQVKEFRQKGLLTVGTTVMAKGVIIDNQKFAEEIKVFDSSKGEVSIKVKNVPEKVNIKVRGPLDQINNFIQQISSFLSNLLS